MVKRVERLLECTLPDDAFEPILLTPEIIIRCGFEKGETEEDISMKRYYKEKFIIEKGCISECFDNTYSFRITTDRFNSTHVCDVKYVHQLQNIYFITNNNKELTIKLD